MVDTNKKQKTAGRPIVSLRRRQAVLTILLGGAILISGSGIGFGSAMAFLGGEKEVETTTTDDPKQRTEVAGVIAHGVAEKCGLDKQQTGEVREIMSKRLKALHEIRLKAMDEMVAVHREITADMRRVMKPDQFKLWEKHNEEARKRSRFRHHRWGRRSQRGGDPEGRGKHGGRNGHYGPGKSRPDGKFDMFKRLDKDNSGELTEDETKKVFGPFQKFLEKADTNGDGKIDRKEYDTQLRHRRPPSFPGQMRKPRDRPDSSPSSAPAPDLSMIWF